MNFPGEQQDRIQRLFRNSSNGYWVCGNFAFSHIILLDNRILTCKYYNVVVMDNDIQFDEIKGDLCFSYIAIQPGSETEISIVSNDPVLKEKFSPEKESSVIINHYVPGISDPSLFQKNPP